MIYNYLKYGQHLFIYEHTRLFYEYSKTYEIGLRPTNHQLEN